MRNCVRATIGLFSLFGTAVAEPPAAEVYGRLPAIGGVAISPDGSKLVFNVNIKDLSGVRVFDTEGTALTAAHAGENERFRAVGWADDGIASFLVSQTLSKSDIAPIGTVIIGGPDLYEYVRAGTVTVKDANVHIMLKDLPLSWAQSTLAGLYAPIEGDYGFGRMAAWTLEKSEAVYALFRVDLSKEGGTVAQILPERTLDLLLDSRGNEYARTESDVFGFRWNLFVREHGSERLVRAENGSGNTPALEGIFPDGRIGRVHRPAGGDYLGLSATSTKDGTSEMLFQPSGYDLGDAIHDPWTHQIVGARWVDNITNQQHFFDAQLETMRTEVGNALGAYSTNLLSWSRDRLRIVLFAETSRDAGSFYLYEPKARTLSLLGRTYPELPEANLGHVAAITYLARDKTTIPAYLTIPPGKEPKNLPLVLLVHGGPSARDTADFDWWAQFLASRGYLVLQPNYRGSVGFGRKWTRAGYGQWGGLMQTDVEDGVAALVQSGYADPKRVCIIGASYGGYAAQAGATLTPNRYTCAVSVAGISDLNLLYKETTDKYGEDSPQVAFWTATIGDPTTQADHLRAVSPIEHVADVRIPMLFIHGTHDTVVPIEQTKLMYDRLIAAHKNVRFVQLPGDDHWLSHASSRTLMLSEIEKFLRQMLPTTPGERPVAAATPQIPIIAFAGRALAESGGTSRPAMDIFSSPVATAPKLDELPGWFKANPARGRIDLDRKTNRLY